MAGIDIGDRVEHHARAAAHEAAPWVVGLARFGFAARGVVYVIIGVLAARSAMGKRGSAEGTEGALAEILQAPGGRAMLGLVAVGLVGYALWRLVEAALDPDHVGTDGKGIVKRAAYALSGVIHVALALTAARMALAGSSAGSGSGEGNADSWTARLMEAPAGRYLVIAVGLGFLGFGAYQLRKAVKADVHKGLDLSSLSVSTREWAVRAARAGLAARGVVFGIIGVFLVQAGLRYDPNRALGLEGALENLRTRPYGPWLLGAVGVGLVGYGLFEIVKARYRRIRPT